MISCVSGILMALAIVLIPVSASGETWEQTSSSPLRQIVKGQDFQTEVNWEDGYLEVTGEATCDPSLSVNQSHCYTMALKAARALAYEKLTETVHGLNVSSSNTFQDEVIANTLLKTSVQGLIRDARIISEETTTMPDGSPLVKVRLGLLIKGPRGLNSAIVQHAHQTDYTPEIAKLRADFERANAQLRESRARADRLETLVQQVTEKLSEQPSTSVRSTEYISDPKALERAEAALRVAEEARKIAAEVARAAEEAQARSDEISEGAASREEIEEALAAANEAKQIAERLAGAAESAERAAAGAREAGVAAGERAQELASFLEQSRSLTAQLKEAREEAQAARQKTEDALSRLSATEAIIVAGDDGSAAQALELARNASSEARSARQQVVVLEAKVREMRFSADSLAALGLDRNEEALQLIRSETTRLAEDLAETKEHQYELEQQASASLAQATMAVEQVPTVQQSPEFEAMVEQMKQSVQQAQELQAAVAGIEQRAAAAEIEAAKMRETVLAVGVERAEIAQSARQTAEAVSMVRGLLDSIRTVSRTAVVLDQQTRTTSTEVIEVGTAAFTGLIVDASCLQVRPAFKPRVFSPDGQEVYGESKASRKVALDKMYADWCNTPESARAKYKNRVGENPLVVRALDATGKHRSDLIVSREDALLVERADRKSGFLKDCKVAIAILPST